MSEVTMAPRLKDQFKKEVTKKLQEELGLKNVHQVPQLKYIVVNVGLGRSKEDKALIELVENNLAKITGQAPIKTYARKSIAGFKLREGQAIGYKVTLRGARMYEFIDRLINTVLPRVRDFHGVPNSSFDGHGNYTIGIKEQSVFPELTYKDTATLHGLEITIVTSTDNDEHAKALLAAFDMPFEKSKES